MTTARLDRVELPDFGKPVTEPALGRPVFDARIRRLRERMAEAGLDALVIYGDREHTANITWATGYDPRFEEALLLLAPGRDPVILTGPENQGTARRSAIDVEVEHR